MLFNIDLKYALHESANFKVYKTEFALLYMKYGVVGLLSDLKHKFNEYFCNLIPGI